MQALGRLGVVSFSVGCFGVPYVDLKYQLVIGSLPSNMGRKKSRYAPSIIDVIFGALDLLWLVFVPPCK
jgi:hypothetical protein